MSVQVEETPITDQQLEDIKAGARILFSPKQLVEVRARTANGYWRGLYFTDHNRMAEVVLQLDRDARIQSLYYVFNKINPKLFEARLAGTCACDKCTRGGLVVTNPTAEQIEKIITGPSQHLTADEDIETLNFMFIDVDTIRAPGLEHEPSSDEEKKASKAVMRQVRAYLTEKNWPEPLGADSGNGFHALPKINLPNNETNVALILDCLKALAAKFNCPAAKIDDSVRNAARLTRAYGSTTRKGTSTDERPYRQNKIYQPKGFIGTVTLDQILALGDEGPKTSKTPHGDMPLLHTSFEPDDFFEWFEEQGAFEVTGTSNWQGHEVKIIDHCIISGTKHSGSKLTGFIIGDSFGYHCWSPECNDPNIGDVLRALHEQGFKRYPKKIWIEEPPLLNFEKKQAAFAETLAEESEQYRPPVERESALDEAKRKDVLSTPLPEFEAIEEEVVQQNEGPSIITKLEEHIAAEEAEETGITLLPPKSKKIRIGALKPNQYAEWLMTVIFRDPKKALIDWSFYRRRLDRIASHLTDAVREAFGAMIFFERRNKYLPSKDELIDYLLNSEDCLEVPIKDQTVVLIRSIKDDGTHFFDTTAQRLIAEMDWRLESEYVRENFNKYLKNEKKDVEAFRTALKKYWSTTIGLNSDFKSGTWQENTVSIYEAFRRDLTGEGDARKFKLGYNSIDDSGMNIGLDGNHTIAVYGPASNRKTNFVMSMALNFAMQGKRGLFLAGEHLREKIEKRLTLMLSYYLRKTEENPDGLVPSIPGLRAWESLKRTATQEDLANIGIVLAELKAMRVVPGYLEVQNIHSLIRGADDPVGAIMDYIDSTHKKYDWDFIIIDPLDTILPVDQGDKNQQLSAAFAVIDRLFDYSRSFGGDRGLMIVVTAQFKADVRRDIEKVQSKNGGADDFDDEIVSILRRDSGIQFIGNKLTQRFDLAIGVALRVKDGMDGMLVKGRSREDNGTFDVVYVTIDQESNLMLEAAGAITRRVATGNSDKTPSTLEDHSPYDKL